MKVVACVALVVLFSVATAATSGLRSTIIANLGKECLSENCGHPNCASKYPKFWPFDSDFGPYIDCQLQNIKGEGVRHGETLFIGDSNIDYWAGVSPGSSGSAVPNSYNIGVKAATCSDVASWTSKALDLIQPSTVVLHCGENDMLLAFKSPSEAFSALKEVIAKIKAAPSVKRLVYFGTMDEPLHTGLTGFHVNHLAYDNLFETQLLPSQQDYLTFINLRQRFKALGNPNNLYASDWLHPSPKGYTLWSTYVKEALDG